jgi:hypothetical protein
MNISVDSTSDTPLLVFCYVFRMPIGISMNFLSLYGLIVSNDAEIW